MPIAITDTQTQLAQSIREWVRRCEPVTETRAAEEPADAFSHQSVGSSWQSLAEIGVLGIAVPEQLGGSGGTVADAAAALAEVAAGLAPGPVLTTVLAGALLSRTPDAPLTKELAPALAEGTVHIGVQFTGLVADTALAAKVTPDGGLTVTGDAGLVLGADNGAHLLLAATVEGQQAPATHVFVLPPGHPGVRIEPATPMDCSRSIARAHLDGVVVAPTSVLDTGTGVARDLLLSLAAAEAAGIADWCTRTAAEYARVRVQFGRPIGSFQAVKHLCAGLLCRSEQAAALAWDAARAADEDTGQHELAAACAAAGALDAAVDNAKDCIQVLGGIGFTWEHDAHLYLRRALALRQSLGGTGRWRARTAELVVGGTRRTLEVDTAGAPAGDLAAIRSEISEIAALPPAEQRVRLAESGYLMPHWPRPYGLDAPADLQLFIDTELHRAGVVRPGLAIGGWAAPTILEHGTPEQVRRFVGPTLRGEIAWCQLFSEPEAGSDLAALRTTAVRVDSNGGTPTNEGVAGGGWRLTGQKVWTSLAREADWAICLARTDPEAPKHKGITYVLVDMRAEGIDTRPLREITGEAVFNEVFLNDVFVPDSDVVGEVGGGWKLARTTLANERVAMSRGSALSDSVERLLSLVADRGASVPLDELGRLVVDGATLSVFDLRSVVRSLRGQDPGPESSVRKLLGVRHRQDVAEVALDALGIDALVVDDSVRAAQHEFLLSRCLSIAGGTTQVLLNVAAERLLGLPRS